MFDLQIFIAILATLFLFLTSVVLAYDKLQFRNYDLPIPQWFGLSLAGITFGVLVADQILRGFVRLEERRRILEEEQRRAREENFRIEEEQRRISEARSREREIARTEAYRIEERERRVTEERRRIREERRRISEARSREGEAIRAENQRIEAAERETRRTRIETRYRIALIQFQLDPSAASREQLANILALLREYQDTL
jgi:hypothetical protein